MGPLTLMICPAAAEIVSQMDIDAIALVIEAVVEIVISETETILIQEMNVGNEIMNSKMIISLTMFKIWFEMSYILTMEVVAVALMVHSMIFDKVLAHHGSSYKDSSLEPVVTIEHVNLLNS